MFALITGLADAGCAVVIVSSDFTELARLCDRVLVMRETQLIDEVPFEELTEARLVRACFGPTPVP
jgi:ribose transport system ATP-binding protein